MKKNFTIIFLLLFTIFLSAQSEPPKREFRGAWIASVVNLDWPSSPNLTTEQQKQQLIDILDGLKESGINAVIFQIRPECDALYDSPYEPWSYWLTGQQGKAPNPYYDPLKFAVEEAHKRGMEIHAWFNPYRAVRDVGSYTISPEHVSVQHPDWILTFGSLKILNPGLQEVRDFVTKVIMDVVRRYDVDGVHFDDYFYPYSGINNEDQATFNQYPRGFTNIGDWRRDNVNIFVKEVYDSIQTVKPYVKLGISPFGIWKNGVPPGIVGLDAYNVLYADAMAWLHQHSIDYLTPQLYWQFGGGQDYGKLMPWWADSTNAYNRHLYPGLAAYRIVNWSASEVPNQIRLNRKTPSSLGEIFFRALVGVLDNPKGFNDTLKNDLYRYPALLPIMNWKDTVKPNAPQNLEFGRIASTARAGLKWDLPNPASDGDTAKRYVVYHFNNSSPQQSDFDNPENILDILGSRESFPSSSNLTSPFYFAVTSLDRNYNESAPSSVVEILPPDVPLLALPFDNEINQRDTVNLEWNYAPGSTSYQLQIAKDSTFADSVLFYSISKEDTFDVVTNFEGLKKYYWKVKAKNIAGESNYSQVFSFTTGFPETPVLLDPPHATVGVSLNPTLTWASSDSALSYELQLSKSLTTFNSQTILFDTTNLSDTTFTLSNLEQDKIYYWRVSGVNQYGKSLWSEVFGFRTEKTTSVEKEEGVPTDYILSQNYPNPFNPSTTISYQIPKAGLVTLKVYDVLGREVAVLVNKEQPAGSYEVNFDASNPANETGLPSGIYIYRLQSGNYSGTKKLLLLK